MKTIGFVISHKENENRRALLPEHIQNIKNKKNLYFETGYGIALGIDDKSYTDLGCHIVSREVAMEKDIICDPKVGDGNYISDLNEGQMIFGWVHAVQNRDITDILVDNKISVIAWEDMYNDGRHSFWRNNEIAGEAAVLQAILFDGNMPYETKTALIGRGNIARGAYRILTDLGSSITVYDRKTEALLRKEIGEYDYIVNGVLWDTSRDDHIIYKEDLLRMKKGAMIIDISCDRNGGVETSIPTTIENPVYEVDGIKHYVVDHTPALFYKTVTRSISEVVSKYIDFLIEDSLDSVLREALIVFEGDIIDQRINEFQKRVKAN